MSIKGCPFNIAIDSCAFHPPQEKEKAATLELSKLRDEGMISAIISNKVDKELSKAPHHVARKRLEQIYTLPVNLTSEEKTTKQKIRSLLFGNKSNLKENELNDIYNIFEAQKYGCRYFVTTDKKHLLAKAVQIEQLCSMRVVEPTKCLSEIKEWIERHRQH
jgi:predicted nucleic acid-binding protein